MYCESGVGSGKFMSSESESRMLKGSNGQAKPPFSNLYGAILVLVINSKRTTFSCSQIILQSPQ